MKFTLTNKAGGTALSASKLYVTAGGSTYTVNPSSAANELYVAIPGIDSNQVTLTIAMKDANGGNKCTFGPMKNEESLIDYSDMNLAVTTSQSGATNSNNFNDANNYPSFYAALHNTITASDGITASAPNSGTSG